MVAASILPVTVYNNTLYFLFGKEAPGNDTPGFSDFGGGVDPGENITETAFREGAEELTGFLGNPDELRELIQKSGGTYDITHDTYHIHIFYIKYDENLPAYYTKNHRFVWSRLDHKMMKETKIFEKIEIEWFSLKDMKKRRNEFRSFYQNIVDQLSKESPKIRKFIESNISRSPARAPKSNTRKNRKSRRIVAG